MCDLLFSVLVPLQWNVMAGGNRPYGPSAQQFTNGCTMGLFDWLFKAGNKNFEALADSIWLNEPARLAGFHRELMQRLDAGDRVLIATYFPAMFDQVGELLRLWDISFDDRNAIESARDIDRWDGSNGPILQMADVLPDDNPDERMSLVDENVAAVSVLVPERHPLRSHDDRIERFTSGLPCRSRLQFFLSLDDPLMKLFVTDSVKSMLTRVGMKEDEPIESEMVSRRVAGAQKKIKDSLVGDSPAQSAAEWMALNWRQ